MKKLLLIVLFLVPFTAQAQTSGGVPTYAEDTQHVSGQKGLFPLCRRADVATSTAGSNNDYGAFNCDADGKLWVAASVDTTGLATEATLASIDGNITACDTTGLATEATLASIDGNITACDTTDVTITSMPAVSVGAPTLTEATFAAVDTTAAGSIGVAYASAVNLPDDTKVVILRNLTDGDVMVSFDGGSTDTFVIQDGETLSIDFAKSWLKTTADVQLKDITTTSTGNFYISSYK